MNTIAEFEQRVSELLKMGQNTIKLRDADNRAWESGYAYWLLNNFEYNNGSDFSIVNITQKKCQV